MTMRKIIPPGLAVFSMILIIILFALWLNWSLELSLALGILIGAIVYMGATIVMTDKF